MSETRPFRSVLAPVNSPQHSWQWMKMTKPRSMPTKRCGLPVRILDPSMRLDNSDHQNLFSGIWRDKEIIICPSSFCISLNHKRYLTWHGSDEFVRSRKGRTVPSKIILFLLPSALHRVPRCSVAVRIILLRVWIERREEKKKKCWKGSTLSVTLIFVAQKMRKREKKRKT